MSDPKVESVTDGGTARQVIRFDVGGKPLSIHGPCHASLAAEIAQFVASQDAQGDDDHDDSISRRAKWLDHESRQVES